MSAADLPSSDRRRVEDRSSLSLRRRSLLLGGWRWLLLLGGGVVKLQRLPDLPELLVDQLQSQRSVQRLERGKGFNM